MAELSEAERKIILGAAYVPRDPSAPKEKSWLGKILSFFGIGRK